MAETVHGENTWEYNAPQFVDFTTNPHEDDDADAWFGKSQIARRIAYIRAIYSEISNKILVYKLSRTMLISAAQLPKTL